MIAEAETGYKMGHILDLTWTYPMELSLLILIKPELKTIYRWTCSLHHKDQGVVLGKVPMSLFFWFWAEWQRFQRDFEDSEDSNSRIEVAKECIWSLLYTGVANVKEMYNSGPSIIHSPAQKQGPTACILDKGPKLPATFRDSTFFHCKSAGSPKYVVNSPDLLEELGARLGCLINCAASMATTDNSEKCLCLLISFSVFDDIERAISQKDISSFTRVPWIVPAE